MHVQAPTIQYHPAHPDLLAFPFCYYPRYYSPANSSANLNHLHHTVSFEQLVIYHPPAPSHTLKMGQCVSNPEEDQIYMDEKGMLMKSKYRPPPTLPHDTLPLRQAPVFGPKGGRITVNRDMHWTSSISASTSSSPSSSRHSSRSS